MNLKSKPSGTLLDRSIRERSIGSSTSRIIKEDLLNEHNDEPLVRFINQTIEEAICNQVSDIHFEPYEETFRVRFRQDGLLHEVTQLSSSIAPRLTARIKIMANLDITEHRKPQDGRCSVSLRSSYPIDLRVNTCPMLHGEKIVLRLLDQNIIKRDLNDLELNSDQYHTFLSAIQKQQGLILVTGPTGSGKTVTLYAAIQYLNKIEKNILTAEEPVEISLPYINQANINIKTGLTFSKLLRAFLRQDPDIIMIGEIRDRETAEIAIHAAQTGHLVFSTLHTNSTTDAITRLQNMNISPYNLTCSLLLVTSQRLLRKLCPLCKTRHTIPNRVRNQLHLSDSTPLFKAGQCEKCSNGYKGRIAVHELLPILETHPHAILQNNKLSLPHLTQKNKVTTLHQSAIEKLSKGLTSLDEIHRILSIKHL